MGHPAKILPDAPTCQFDGSSSECAASSSEEPQLVVENTFLRFKEHEQTHILTRNNSAPAELSLLSEPSEPTRGTSSPDSLASEEREASNFDGKVCAGFFELGPTQDSTLDTDQKKIKPQDLEVLEVDGRIQSIFWTVDARKLKGGDRVAVSPRFELQGAFFRIMMLPKVTDSRKGGSSFRKAQGKGLLQLKCESNMQDGKSSFVKFKLVVGTTKTNLEAARGPVLHDYSKSGVAGLNDPQNPEKEVWDFEKWVEGGTFVVGLQILL